MARILLIEPLLSVARKIEQTLLLAGHAVTATISGEQGARLWSNARFDVLLMNFETDDWNTPEVFAELLAGERTPKRAVIYFDQSITPDMLADRTQEIAPLMPSGQLGLLRQGGDFNSKLYLVLASVLTAEKEEEV